jgi:competence protein ComEC
MICANGRTKPGASVPFVFTFMLLLLACPLIGWAADNEMQIYFIDVEGGQATLFVAPGGKSLLIDTGWPEHAARDAGRIVHAAKLAGLHEIDVVLLTHYHDDHTGGVPQLVERIPVHTFIDHGPNIENKEGSPTEKRWEDYQKVLATGRYRHIVAHAGNALPIGEMKVTVVSSAGDVIRSPLPGAGQTNQFCSISESKPADPSENAQSLGVLVEFGQLRNSRSRRSHLG